MKMNKYDNEMSYLFSIFDMLYGVDQCLYVEKN